MDDKKNSEPSANVQSVKILKWYPARRTGPIVAYATLRFFEVIDISGFSVVKNPNKRNELFASAPQRLDVKENKWFDTVRMQKELWAEAAYLLIERAHKERL